MPHRLGPADIAREIAAVVRDHEAAGRTHDLVLLGSDASDTGDFQVGIRLAYELGRPVVNGATTVTVEDGVAVAVGKGPEGQETYRVPVARGRHDPRGRRRAALSEREGPDGRQEGPDRGARAGLGAPRAPAGQLLLPPPHPSSVQILGEGADAAPAVVDLFEQLGVLSR